MEERVDAMRFSTMGPRLRTDRTRLRRNRRLVAEWIAVALVAAGILSACLSATRVLDPDEITTRQIRVESGQSLWRLAIENPIPGASALETSELIKQVNGMEASALCTGDVIDVPAQGQSERGIASR